MKKCHYIVVALLLALTALVAAEKTPRTLSVTGTAEVTVKPDICYMSFSINTENIKKAIEAYQMNNETSEKVRTAIKSAGIEDKDIQTTYYSITPKYHWDDKPKNRIFDDYTVYHTLSISVRNLDEVSNILDVAMTSGVSEVGGINFTVENPKKYTASARIEAIKAAREKAEVIVKEMGMKLLKPTSIYEIEPGTWTPYYSQANVGIGSSVVAGEQTGLEPGQTKLSHSVSITYEIE